MQYWLWSVPPDALAAFVRAETFALRRQGRRALGELRVGDRVAAYIPGSKTLAALVEVAGEPFEDATALVPGRHLPHRVRVRALTILPREAWVPYDGFAPHLAVLREYPDEPTPDRQFRRVVQRVLHRLPAIDGKVVEFLFAARRGADPEALMQAVEAVRDAREHAPAEPARGAEAERAPAVVAEPAGAYEAAPFDRAEATEHAIAHIAARGFVYEPWQVATFLAALRTKPLVLLAGVTGVGKSRLPHLVADATGSTAALLPVRPDWTDPSDTLGYTGLDGRFRPGALLREAADAREHPERQRLLVLDEMNLARPEHYLAEVLSRLEARAPTPHGPESPPLLSETLAPDDALWQAVRFPASLSLVGTVNVDESAHVFSRKVLDRAFTLELHAADLSDWRLREAAPIAPARWPSRAWHPRALRLAELRGLGGDEQAAVERAVQAVGAANAILAPADLGVGYRSRDEAALFVLHAGETPAAFRTRGGDPVDPLDVALLTKLVPRVDGVGIAAKEAVAGVLGWAWTGAPSSVHEARDLVAGWADSGRPRAVTDAVFPRTAARLARIVEAAEREGVVSFWA